ncbi:MAG: hypothetical protein AB1349_06935 [Elusimicrobiota bacterium]
MTKVKLKTKSAIQSAIDYGIDVSLLYESVSLTPTQRIQKNQEMLEVAEELKKAGEKKHGKI